MIICHQLLIELKTHLRKPRKSVIGGRVAQGEIRWQSVQPSSDRSSRCLRSLAASNTLDLAASSCAAVGVAALGSASLSASNAVGEYTLWELGTPAGFTTDGGGSTVRARPQFSAKEQPQQQLQQKKTKGVVAKSGSKTGAKRLLV